MEEDFDLLCPADMGPRPKTCGYVLYDFNRTAFVNLYNGNLVITYSKKPEQYYSSVEQAQKALKLVESIDSNIFSAVKLYCLISDCIPGFKSKYDNGKEQPTNDLSRTAVTSGTVSSGLFRLVGGLNQRTESTQ